MTIRTILRITIAAVALTLALGACGGGDRLSSPSDVPETAPPAVPESSAPSASDALVARSSSDLAVFARSGDAIPAQTLPATTEFGSAHRTGRPPRSAPRDPRSSAPISRAPGR